MNGLVAIDSWCITRRSADHATVRAHPHGPRRCSCNPDRSDRLDLRPVVSDITPDAIAGGALTNVNTAGLTRISGDFIYLQPIEGVRQIAATGFNYRKHIEEMHMKPPTEPEVFADRTVRPNFPRPQPRGEAGLGDRSWRSSSATRRGTSPSPRHPTISSATSV
jgi:hypothetical protein